MFMMMFLKCMIITLAIGFGAGYWLLVTAEDQSKKGISILGAILGWILIVFSITTLLLGLFFRPSFKENRPFPMMMHHMEEMHGQYPDFHKHPPMHNDMEKDAKPTPEHEQEAPDKD